ncbi:hypothetical protein [Aquimarina sp. SS2-1]|uniref:hypothetical protein n=1 Tax=Aquimarina besae TaxID=3342247 RepID=UPI003671ED8C
MKDSLRRIHAFLLICCGFLTLLMSKIIPIGGGGISLIFGITTPFFIIIGIVFGAISFYGVRSNTKRRIVVPLLIYFYVSLLIGTLLMFPFE